MCLEGEYINKENGKKFPRFKKVAVIKEEAVKNFGGHNTPTYYGSSWELEDSCKVSTAQITNHRGMIIPLNLNSCKESLHRLLTGGEVIGSSTGNKKNIAPKASLETGNI